MRGGYTMSALCLFPSILVNTLETACTWADFPKLHAAVMHTARAAIRRHCQVDGEVTCRLTHVYTDGPAPYYTLLVKGLQNMGSTDEDGRIRMWLNIKEEVMSVIMANGGTCTHHHAVGRLHLPHYAMESGALFEATLRAAKGVHDPAGIVNPGTLLARL